MSSELRVTDPMVELRFALAEADSTEVPGELRARISDAAHADRPSGWSSVRSETITSVAAFRTAADRLDGLLVNLRPEEWTTRTIRGLDVQGLIGHLIGVESGFAGALAGDRAFEEASHVAATDAQAEAQAGREFTETLSDWRSAVDHTMSSIEQLEDLGASVRFHRISLPIESFLVVRSFEIWTHAEDIRRATNRALEDPEPGSLKLMTELATRLLPAGVAAVGSALGGSVRLVLIGAGGGAWDVPPRGTAVTRAQPGMESDAHVTVDAAEFCRVVSNRSTLEDSAAVVSGEIGVAAALFAGAAALALD